jgi:hypothetical protein
LYPTKRGLWPTHCGHSGKGASPMQSPKKKGGAEAPPSREGSVAARQNSLE